jgi:hypothetical protein
MRLPRLTTWRWLIVVAVVAVTMGGFVGTRVVWQYIVAVDRVRYHGGMERMARRYGHILRFPWLPVEPDPPKP